MNIDQRTDRGYGLRMVTDLLINGECARRNSVGIGEGTRHYPLPVISWTGKPSPADKISRKSGHLAAIGLAQDALPFFGLPLVVPALEGLRK
jgi:hypothetical protein